MTTRCARGHRLDTTSSRRVLAAVLVGTTIEAYDFFTYASAAGLVFGRLFFSGLGPAAALTASFATLGVTVVVRPAGGLLAGHLGDRLGRKRMLVASLLLMGTATVGVGLLPTDAAIGPAAPGLLMALRVLQGLSGAGEWGGAALMAVEHAPHGRRGWFGGFPQLGTPLGLLLSNAVFCTVTALTDERQFLTWGWRLPFLISIVLVAVGFLIRSRVEESPAFDDLLRRRARRSAPVGELLRDHRRAVLVGSGLFVGNALAGYVLIAFITAYGTQTLHLPSAVMLTVGGVGAISWGIFTMLAARWSDVVGRRRVYAVGATALLVWPVPLFLLLETRALPWMLLAVIGLGFALGTSFGQQAATYAEMFPVAVRSSGASLACALGAVAGGAFTPLIAERLVSITGTSLAVAGYMMLAALCTMAAVVALRERPAAEREAFVDGGDRPPSPPPGGAGTSWSARMRPPVSGMDRRMPDECDLRGVRDART